MKEMSFLDHLDDLRKTLIKILIILAISFIACYSWGDQISELLLSPLRETLISGMGKIVYLGVLDKVLSQFQVAFWSAVIFSSPLWFREIWSFIKPGLYEREVKIIRPFIFTSFLFFCLGVSFGYFIVFPVTFKTLMNFGVGNIDATIGLKEYLVLASKVLVFLGVIFQLPNILLILGLMGLVTKYSLRNMRRYVYVAFALIAAMLTPPDIITMMGLWFPLVLLFEVGILPVIWLLIGLKYCCSIKIPGRMLCARRVRH